MDARDTGSRQQDASPDTDQRARQDTAGSADQENAGFTGESAPGSDADKQTETELMDELENLGRKFREVVETAWNSEQRRQAEDKLHTGISSLAHSLEQGVKDVSSRKEAQELRDAAEDMATRVRRSKITHDLADVLAQGLRTLSEQLDRLSKEMKHDETTSASATSSSTAQAEPGSQSENDAQDIPIDRV